MQFNFNAANAPVPTAPEYGPLPAGEYTMIITRTEIKSTKAGTGEYLECVMEVVEGKSAGRKHWERFNVSNPNKTAEDIAKAALGNLWRRLRLTAKTRSATASWATCPWRSPPLPVLPRSLSPQRHGPGSNLITGRPEAR
jgi:hypothetical protein